MVDSGPKSRFSSAEAQETDGSNSSSSGEPAGAEAAKRVAQQVAELREYFSYLLAAKLDGAKVSIRNIGIYAALGVVGLIAAFAMIFIAVEQVLGGIAGGLAELTGRPWLGNLTTGALVLAIIAVAVVVGLGKVKSAAKARTIAKYEDRKLAQQAQFGRDVQQAANAAPVK